MTKCIQIHPDDNVAVALHPVAKGEMCIRDSLVADALAESVNTVAVRVGMEAGIRNIYNFVTKQLHITTLTKDDVDAGPMVLGSSTHGITPYELAGAYMIFGSGGTYTTLHCYERVESGAGRVLLVPDVETEQVIDSDTAYTVSYTHLTSRTAHSCGAQCGFPGS